MYLFVEREVEITRINIISCQNMNAPLLILLDNEWQISKKSYDKHIKLYQNKRAAATSLKETQIGTTLFPTLSFVCVTFVI